MISQRGNSNQKTIMLVGGYWATNIGNAFYELGIMHVLNSIENVRLIRTTDSQSISWSRWNVPWSNPFNPYDVCDIERLDYIAIAGPMMSVYYLDMLKPLFYKSMEYGKKIIFLSAGGNSYDEDERVTVRRVLNEIKPFALVTRDHDTYNKYADIFSNSYDGICFASYIPDFFVSWKLSAEKYVVLDMESNDEPVALELDRNDTRAFFFDDKYWGFDKPIYPIKRFLPCQRTAGEKIFENYDIVRTKNTCMRPIVGRYRGNNVFISDIPDDYLNIYANAGACISDRVHTCVASLVLGRPTMFLGNTQRSLLFENLIGDDTKRLTKEFVQIDPHQLNDKKKEQKCKIMEWLKQ